jgi:CRISPR-associated exonuclease Cas4
MRHNKPITGNLLNAYYICHRKLWLFAHEVNPPTDNSCLEIGRLIGENSYKGEKKEIQIRNIKIDLIKKENGNVIIAEIKKSSKGTKAARMQLLFYLYQLKNQGVEAKGELLIPKERKKEEILLTEELEKELEKTMRYIQTIIAQPNPPTVHKTHFCRVCAYKDLCFA